MSFVDLAEKIEFFVAIYVIPFTGIMQMHKQMHALLAYTAAIQIIQKKLHAKIECYKL